MLWGTVMVLEKHYISAVQLLWASFIYLLPSDLNVDNNLFGWVNNTFKNKIKS